MKTLLTLIIALVFPGIVYAQVPPPVALYEYVGEVSVLAITGNAMFDFFFTVIMFFGLLAFSASILFKILSRS